MKVVAFYLPQFYPTPTNSHWYGEGFTEWTNVRSARRLFRGHQQPRVPADLGYYDLRDPQVRRRQAELAREGGIAGFCYYHYWFGNGRRELDLPLKLMLGERDLDMPFCLCWANESWHSKFWKSDASCAPRLIVEQRYDDPADCERHFMELLPAFADPRYMRHQGRLMFMIYRPDNFPKLPAFIEQWRNLARKHLDTDFFFIGHALDDAAVERCFGYGLDGANIMRKDDYRRHWRFNNPVLTAFNKFRRALGHAPYHYDYRAVSRYFIDPAGAEASDPRVFPTIIPNWDHTPRSGKRGSAFTGSTPAAFGCHLAQVKALLDKREPADRLAFLLSWNEWGEGNYIEPDTLYGHGYLKELHRQLSVK